MHAAVRERSPVAGDVLIGADGVHSQVRQSLFGEDRPQFTGIIVWRGIVPMEKLPKHMARMVGSNWVGPGAHVVHYPLRAGKVMNFVGALERSDWQVESWSARGTTEELAADFAGWHEDVHALIRNIPAPYKWALMTRAADGALDRRARHAARRRLPLDGAVPRAGRGDGDRGWLRPGALPGEVCRRAATALRRYEHARRERTRKAVEGSAANIARFHHPALADPAKAREYVEREWAGQNVAERYEWLFRYDAATAPI